MKQGPINLNFLTLHFPVTAWVSVAHRLSGILMVFMIPLLLWILQESLATKEGFMGLKLIFNHPICVIGLSIILIALLYHWIAGVRHLLMDSHIGESKLGGRVGAWLVIGFSGAFILLIGYKLW